MGSTDPEALQSSDTVNVQGSNAESSRKLPVARLTHLSGWKLWITIFWYVIHKLTLQNNHIDEIASLSDFFCLPSKLVSLLRR